MLSNGSRQGWQQHCPKRSLHLLAHTLLQGSHLGLIASLGRSPGRGHVLADLQRIYGCKRAENLCLHAHVHCRHMSLAY